MSKEDLIRELEAARKLARPWNAWGEHARLIELELLAMRNAESAHRREVE